MEGVNKRDRKFAWFLVFGQYLASDLQLVELSPVLDGELPPNLNTLTVSTECSSDQPLVVLSYIYVHCYSIHLGERARGSSLFPENRQ